MAELDLNVFVKTKGTEKLNGIGGSLAKVGKVAVLGAAAVGGAVALAGTAFAGMASEAEDAQTKLESVFKSTGASAHTSIEALNEHATSLAKATTFDDEGIKAAQATLLSFGSITGESLTDATEASADLAAFMGTDIPSAAKQLGKALAIPELAAGKLAKQGIILSEAQQLQIDKFVEAGDTAAAQGVILDAFGEKFGGVATAMAETSGGQMAQALEDLGEAGESIGTLLLPIIVKVAQALAGLADFVVAAMPTIQAAIAPVVAFITGLFQNTSGSVSGLQQIFAGLVAWVQANLPTIMSVAGQVFGAVANVVKSVMPVIIELAKVVLPILGVAATVLFKVLDVAFKAIGGAFEALGNVFDTVAGFIEDTISGVVGFVKGAWNAFASVWNGIQISVPSVDIPFVGVVGGFSIGLPDLPMLAAGGIVSDPTLALLGEKGPEAVIPLDRLQQTRNGPTLIIQGQPDYSMTEERIIRSLTRAEFLTGF